MVLPENIQRLINGRPFSVDCIGMSDSQVLCFEDMVLKIEKTGEEPERERLMMQWLQDKLPVPRILCAEETDGFQFLLMERIPGQMLCSREFLEQPQKLVIRLAQALHMLWNVDLDGCPCRFSLDDKLNFAALRVAEGLCDTQNVEPDTYGENGFASPEELLKWLRRNRPEEKLCLSHGDLSLPNVFADHDRVCGFVDLGRCSAADPYQDIAICFRSLRNNLNGRYGRFRVDFDPDALFAELGILPDRELIRYYILLDELF